MMVLNLSKRGEKLVVDGTAASEKRRKAWQRGDTVNYCLLKLLLINACHGEEGRAGGLT